MRSVREREWAVALMGACVVSCEELHNIVSYFNPLFDVLWASPSPLCVYHCGLQNTRRVLCSLLLTRSTHSHRERRARMRVVSRPLEPSDACRLVCCRMVTGPADVPKRRGERRWSQSALGRQHGGLGGIQPQQLRVLHGPKLPLRPNIQQGARPRGRRPRNSRVGGVDHFTATRFA